MGNLSERVSRYLVTILLFAICIAVYPFTALPATDVKWLLVGIAALVLLLPRLGANDLWYLCCFRLPGIALFASAIWLALTTTNAPNAGLGIVTVAHQFAFLIFFVASCGAVRSPEMFRRVALGLLVAVFVGSLYGFLQKFSLDPIPWDPEMLMTEEYQNLPSTFGNPNLAGHTLVIALVLAAYMVTRNNWFLMLFFPMLVHLYLTNHRAGLVALTSASIFTGCAWVMKWRGIRSTFVFLGGITSLALVFGILAFSIAATSNTPMSLDGALILRANSFYCAADMVYDRPITGHGTGNYEIASVPYWTSFEQENFARLGRYNAHAHSEYLNLAAESGIPAVFFYAIFLFAMIYRGIDAFFHDTSAERQQLGAVCAAMFVAVAVDSLVGFNWRAPVSGTVAAVCAGCFEGALRPCAVATTRNRPYPARVAIIVLFLGAIGVVWIEVGAFRSQIHLLRGKGAREAGEFPAAIAEFQQSCAHAPWNWIPAYEAARASLRAGNLEDASVWLEQSLRLNPCYLPARIDCARIAIAKLNSHVPADAEFDLAVATSRVADLETVCPFLPEAYELRGHLLAAQAASESSELRIKMHDQASSNFLRAIVAGADDCGRLLFHAAHATNEAGNSSTAFAYATRSIREIDAPDEALGLFVELAIDTGNVKDAIVVLQDHIISVEKTRGIEPQLALSYGALARLHDVLGDDPSQVIALYQKAVLIDSSEDRLWNDLYFFCLKSDSLEKFAVILVQGANDPNRKLSSIASVMALALDNKSPEIGFVLSTIASSMQTSDPYYPVAADKFMAYAAHILYEGTRGQLLAPINRLNLGVALARTGQPAEAEQVLRSFPEGTQEQVRLTGELELVYLLIRTDHAAEAEHIVRDKLKRYPDDTELELALARSFFQQSKLDQSDEQYTALKAQLSQHHPMYGKVMAESRKLKRQLDSEERLTH